MELRYFGLVAAFMLAATTGVASAQDLPDKSSSSSDKTERMPSSENGGAAKEKGSMKSEEGSKSGQRSEGRDRSAQDSSSNQGGAQESKKQKQSDRASGEGKSKNEASKSDQSREKSAQDNKQRDDKAAESKSDASHDKSASDSHGDKSKATADRGKQDDKASTGTSSGETGTGTSGNVTEDKKKIDEVKKVQVSGERRDRLQSAFKSHGDIKHETNVDVNISIGSRAPRGWAFAPVPEAVIEVVPEYRGYVFAYAGDDYVICDPDTYEVVAVLPASGSGGAYASGSGGGSAQCSTSLSLNEDDREAIIRSVEIRNELNVSGVSVGWSVPGDVELRSFPSAVVERRSELSGCRYFITNDQIAIVDPDHDKVVLLIEQK
jgi:uncharacterized protein DUF1236